MSNQTKKRAFYRRNAHHTKLLLTLCQLLIDSLALTTNIVVSDISSLACCAVFISHYYYHHHHLPVSHFPAKHFTTTICLSSRGRKFFQQKFSKFLFKVLNNSYKRCKTKKNKTLLPFDISSPIFFEENFNLSQRWTATTTLRRPN